MFNILNKGRIIMISPEAVVAALLHLNTGVLYNKDMCRFEFFLGDKLVGWHRDCKSYREHKREIDMLLWQQIFERRYDD
jgi:hypothetical protein